MRVFLGVTGASGAPYAKGILDGLVASGAEVGLCASAAGIEVRAIELYGDASLARDDVLRRFVDDEDGVTACSCRARHRSRRSTSAASPRSTRRAP